MLDYHSWRDMCPWCAGDCLYRHWSDASSGRGRNRWLHSRRWCRLWRRHHCRRPLPCCHGDLPAYGSLSQLLLETSDDLLLSFPVAVVLGGEGVQSQSEILNFCRLLRRVRLGLFQLLNHLRRRRERGEKREERKRERRERRERDRRERRERERRERREERERK